MFGWFKWLAWVFGGLVHRAGWFVGFSFVFSRRPPITIRLEPRDVTKDLVAFDSVLIGLETDSTQSATSKELLDDQ